MNVSYSAVQAAIHDLDDLKVALVRLFSLCMGRKSVPLHSPLHRKTMILAKGGVNIRKKGKYSYSLSCL